MNGSNRVHTGCLDDSQKISFSFNGRNFSGYRGDTLASALLANGERFVARSFKYHRPRGIISAGSEEPNALVQLNTGAYQEPNTRATTLELFDGLNARSQNHAGSLKRDRMAINDLFSPWLSAGFYYKTFMFPKSFWERAYEPIIRKSAGLGEASFEHDPDQYDKGFLHCDLLIIGAGASGLMSALIAGRAEVQVILADEDFLIGGRLHSETYSIDDMPSSEWVKKVTTELTSLPNVRIMSRTTIFGAYDHGIYGALERRTDHLPAGVESNKPRQILWRVYSQRAILCTGATERPIAFGNNDRPGIMMAGSMRSYLNRFGVASGKRIAVFTNNDNGWRTAQDFVNQGVSVVAVIDTRDTQSLVEIAGVDIYNNCQIINTKGRYGVKQIILSNGKRISVDGLAVSGGWNPNVHLTCHHRSRPIWDESIAAFVPSGQLPIGMSVVGAAKGIFGLHSNFEQTKVEVLNILKDLGATITFKTATPACEDEPQSIKAFWYVEQSKKRAWLDFQNDVTVKDIKLAHQEGFHSVELFKRYTTLGMATDQGKTANVNALAVMAQCTGNSISETGTTMFRPPYTPVAIGALAGRCRGRDFRPTRYTPSHQWAEEQNAVFVETGMWLRAQWFPQAGETQWRDSVDREVIQTRRSVGVCDVTTLGKIDIQGHDAGEFLHRIYSNNFYTLKVGMVRYGLMRREDGIVYDDGTTARLSEHHYLTTTTTANAVLVYRNMEFYRQCVWPDLDVHLISVTEQWAQYAIAGPNSRELLQKIVDANYDISNEAFPFMACRQISICGGTPARLFRISFSGELAYEIAVPARFGDALIRVLMQAGEPLNVVPYGTEALGVMRIEKGHPAGNELTGQTTALNLGLDGMLAKKAENTDSIGRVLASRPALNTDDAYRLTGFFATDKSNELCAGAHFVAMGKEPTTENDEGWMSSMAYSPTLDRYIGLGFIKQGHKRIGEIVSAYDGLRKTTQTVEIVSPHFIDPEGERLRV